MTVNRWFTSDTHFWHESVIRFCPDTRDGNDAFEMTELMIENWNKTVKLHDIVYHCGDFSFGGKEKIRSLIGRLNGNIHITWGNHDYMVRKSPEFFIMFTSMQDIKHIKVGEYRFIMCHYPLAEWWDCHKGTIMVHGHCVDMSTEILTKDGWKSRDEIFVGDKIVSLNTESGLLEDDIILDLIDNNYTGDVYEVEGKSYSFRVTDEHTMVYKYNPASRIVKASVKEFCERGVSVIALSGVNPQQSGIGWSPELLKLYIFIAADGNIKRETNLARVIVHKLRKVEYLTSILQKLDINYKIHEQDSGGVSVNFYLPNELEGLAIKGLDDILFKSNRQDCDSILESYTNSDGCRNGEGVIIYSAKEREIDLLQAIFVQNGYSASKYSRFHGFGSNLQHQLSVYPREWVRATTIKENLSVEKVSDEHFWCIKSRNQTWIMRRNGKCMITGNCHGNKTNVGHQQRFKMMDVGVDTREDKLMIPYHIDEVLEFVKDRDIMPHHE